MWAPLPSYPSRATEEIGMANVYVSQSDPPNKHGVCGWTCIHWDPDANADHVHFVRLQPDELDSYFAGLTVVRLPSITRVLDDACKAADQCECGAEDWQTSATLISCKRCGRVWGRVNGRWVLDPDSVPAWSG
jgi:hypothetical protein